MAADTLKMSLLVFKFYDGLCNFLGTASENCGLPPNDSSLLLIGSLLAQYINYQTTGVITVGIQSRLTDLVDRPRFSAHFTTPFRTVCSLLIILRRICSGRLFQEVSIFVRNTDHICIDPENTDICIVAPH